MIMEVKEYSLQEGIELATQMVTTNYLGTDIIFYLTCIIHTKTYCKC